MRTRGADKTIFKLAFLLGLLAGAAGLPPSAFAAAPMKINFQGRLEESGVPVDAQKRFIFKMYDDASAGTLIWTSLPEDVLVIDGVFSVVLGSGTPVDLSTTAFAGSGVRYIEVSVDGVTLSPRQEILSAPYALVAQTLSADAKVRISSLDAGELGADHAVKTPQVGLANNVMLSSATAAEGGGVSVSTNIFIAGYSTAAKYYGDGSALTGIGSGAADNLGNHTAAANLKMGPYQITGSGAVTMSSFTALGAGLSAAQWRLAGGNMLLSSASASQLGGVYVSTNMFIVGIASASKFFGDGSSLTGIPVRYYETRVLGGGAGATAEIGYFNYSNGAHNLYISVAVSESNSWSVSKQYAIPITYGMTGGGYLDALPLASSVRSDANDFALEVNVNMETAMLRLRRTAGSVPATAMILIEQSGPSGDVFTPAYGSLNISSFAGILPVTPLTQTKGRVGIGTAVPATKLHMSSGTLTIDGDAAASIIVSGSIGIGTAGPQAALDIVSAGASPNDFAQIWRKPGGEIVSSMSATGVMMAKKFIGDGSGLTGTQGDDLGDHTATMALNMNGNSIVNASSGAFSASLTVAGRPVLTDSGVSAAEGATIASDRASVRLTGAGGAVTLNGAAPVAPGIPGQVMIMVGGSDTNTVTIPAGGDLQLAGQVPFRLGLDDVLVIGYYGGRWVEVQRSDN